MKIVKVCFLLSWAVSIAYAQKLCNIEILKENKIKYNYEVVKSKFSNSFSSFNPDSVEIKTVSYWLRFKYYSNNSNSSIFLNYPYLHYKNIELYYEKDGKLICQKSGTDYKLIKRSLYTPSLVLELPNSNDSVLCYLHVTHYYGYSFFPATSTSKEILYKSISQSNTEFFFFGITTVAIVFSLFLFIYLGEKLYLFYLFFSAMILVSRAVHNGYFINYIPFDYQIYSVIQIFHLYAVTNAGITILLLLYFLYFLDLTEKKHAAIRLSVLIIISIRITLLVLYFLIKDIEICNQLNSRIIDIAMQSLIILMCVVAFKDKKTLSIVAFLSIAVILLGNILNELGESFFGLDSYQIFMTFSSSEVILFLASLGHRHHYLKKEKEESLLLVIDKMKENELLKDAVNRELESKVAERTEEIRKMNELLAKNNIALEVEVKDISKARALQKSMNFSDFSKIFPDDQSCYQHLSLIKWKDDTSYKCPKCKNKTFRTVLNHARRCTKCMYIESPTTGTLFHNTKFSIQKAYFITYVTTTGNSDSTIEELSKEMNMRVATFWAFKKKVLAQIEKTKSLKKHKDGWTHLIEYSIES